MTPDLRIRILAESPLNGKLLLDEMDATTAALKGMYHRESCPDRGLGLCDECVTAIYNTKHILAAAGLL